MSTELAEAIETQDPRDVEAEQAVLGALMWDARLLDDVAEVITGPDDFWDPRHAAVWSAITALAERGAVCDPITVAAELTARDQLAQVGGSLMLADMFGAAIIPAHAVAHARIVADRATQRRTLAAAQKIRAMALRGGEDPAAMVEAAQQVLDRVQPNMHTETRSVGDIVAEVIDRMDDPDADGLPTPWADLNEVLGGLAGGRLYMVGARPAIGKSLLLQGLAVHWATTHHKPTLFASCEMPGHELTRRMVAAASGVHYGKLGGRWITTDERAAVEQVAGAMPQTHRLLEVADEATQTVASIRAAARRMQRKGGLGLVVVDYLQLLTPGTSSRRDRNREQEVAETTRGLKRLAMELEVPVVVASQLNRQMTTRSDKRPTMSDLRESGAAEQDSDVVLLLHEPDPNDHPNELEVVVAKNRAGSTRTVHLIRQGWVSRLVSQQGGVGV